MHVMVALDAIAMTQVFLGREIDIVSMFYFSRLIWNFLDIEWYCNICGNVLHFKARKMDNTKGVDLKTFSTLITWFSMTSVCDPIWQIFLSMRAILSSKESRRTDKDLTSTTTSERDVLMPVMDCIVSLISCINWLFSQSLSSARIVIQVYEIIFSSNFTPKCIKHITNRRVQSNTQYMFWILCRWMFL